MAKEGCDSGEALGCHKLGLFYETGRFVPKDPKLSAYYYKKACELRPSTFQSDCTDAERVSAEKKVVGPDGGDS
jgi:hypothetical protein